MDGYHAHAAGGEHVTYDRLRAMGTNGFQGAGNRLRERPDRRHEAALLGREVRDRGRRAGFLVAEWGGLRAPGKEEQKASYRFLINNGRANHVWQSAYLDVHNDFVMDRWPYPLIEMQPDDIADIEAAAGDLVEVYNDPGSTQAMAYPTPTARPGETFMLFAYPTGVQGNVVNPGVSELIIPNCKQTWSSVPCLPTAANFAISFSVLSMRTSVISRCSISVIAPSRPA